MTSSTITRIPAFKVYFTRKYKRNQRQMRVVTVLGADKDAARAEFERNINPDVEPEIAFILPVYWSDESGKYVTVPEAVTA